MKKSLVTGLLVLFVMSSLSLAKNESAKKGQPAIKAKAVQSKDMKMQKDEQECKDSKEVKTKKNTKEKTMKKGDDLKKAKETPKGVVKAAENNKGEKKGLWSKWFGKDKSVEEVEGQTADQEQVE